jgi:pyridoxal phosphate enzyme (YggS family)
MTVADKIARFRESVREQDVTLIAVTKFASKQQIEEAFRAGVTEFGENRLQHAQAIRKELPPEVEQGSRWHFIGHLQTNKAKQVVGAFELIHSVDSVNLAIQLSKAASERMINQAILLQVKIASDPNKFGFSSDELKKVFSQLVHLPNLEIQGLMTITPLEADEVVTKTCFNQLRVLRDELEQEHNVQLKELSMGMSDDWPQAVSSGATMVRLGRAIFDN